MLFCKRASVVRVQGAQLGEAVDDGQEVVEVVGDAAGEGAQALHLLRLAQLLLETLALGDVLPQAKEIGDFAGGVPDAGHLDGLPDLHPVGPLPHELALPIVAGGDQLHEPPVGLLVGMALAQDAGVFLQALLEGMPRRLGELRIHVLGPAIGVGDDDGHRALLDRAGKLDVELLGQPLAGDVMTDGPDGDGGAGVVEKDRLLPGHPAPALGRQPAVAAGQLVGRLLQLGLGRGVERHVVGMNERQDRIAARHGHPPAELPREGHVCGQQATGEVAAVGGRGAGGPGGERRGGTGSPLLRKGAVGVGAPDGHGRRGV